MQAVIMAGGKGTRLAAVTKDEIPKPMVPVAGKPLLLWQIEELKRNGIDEIIMIIGHLGHKIEAYFGNGSDYGIRITYIREQMPLGTAGAFYELKKLLQGSYFLLVFGDVCFSVDIRRMKTFHLEHQARATLFVHPNGHPYDSDLVVLGERNRVLRFDSKHHVRDYWYDNCVNAGFYILDRDICGLVQKDTRVDLEKEILAPMAERGEAVYGYCSSEYIKDVGTVERIRQAEADLADGFVRMKCLDQRQRCIFLEWNEVISGQNETPQTKEDFQQKNVQQEKFKLTSDAVDAIRQINQSGYLCIAVTRQMSTAEDPCRNSDMGNMRKKAATLLGKEGVYLDDIFYCPVSLTEQLRQAADRYNIDQAQSWLISRQTADMQNGADSGIRTITCKNLSDAAGKILRNESIRRSSHELHTGN